MTLPEGALVVGPGEGKTFSGRSGYTLATLAGADATRGAYAFQEMTVQPGFPGPVPHIHHNEDEAIYVLEGEITLRVGDQLITAPAGTFVLMPRDVVHTFSNPSTEPTRVLVISSPGAVERYFEEAIALAKESPGGVPNREKLAALAATYNIEFVPRG